MILFWGLSFALIVIAALLIALPLLHKKANQDHLLRDELNTAFYKDRLQELQLETAEGLVDNPDELVEDLKQSLLDDIPAAEQTAEQPVSVAMKGIIISSLLLLVALSYAMYYQFGAYEQVKNWQDIRSQLPQLSQKLMAPQGQGVELSDQDMQDLSLALRTRLHEQPQDATGWLLLGRIALTNRDITTAVASLKRAYQLNAKDVGTQISYAQALMLSNDEADQQQARALLHSLAQQKVADLRVYSLLAFDAFEQADYATAIQYWQNMQLIVGENDSRYEMLTRSIENAQQQLMAVENTTSRLTIRVLLAPQVKLPATGILIVSVHPKDNAALPIAAASYPLDRFPVTITLDDRDNMMPTPLLSEQSEFVVRARIDQDGDVSSKEGDWHGQTGVVTFGAPIDVVIDQQY